MNTPPLSNSLGNGSLSPSESTKPASPQEHKQVPRFESYSVTLVSEHDVSPPSEGRIKSSVIRPGQTYECLRYLKQDQQQTPRLATLSGVEINNYPTRKIKTQVLKAGAVSQDDTESYIESIDLSEDQKTQLDWDNYHLVTDMSRIAEKKKRQLARAHAQQCAQDARLTSFQHSNNPPEDTQDIYTQAFKTCLDTFIATGNLPEIPVEAPQVGKLPTINPAAYATTPGGHSYQEDRVISKELQLNNKSADLFAVFDGHSGDYCAHKAAGELPFCLQRRIHEFGHSMRPDAALFNAMKTACTDVSHACKNETLTGFDENWQHVTIHTGIESGTTACGVIAHNNRLHFLNVGDSRAILVHRDGTSEQMTEDAKPGDEHYLSGITKRLGVTRTVPGESEVRLGGYLSPARGLGDGFITGMNPRPKITEATITDDDILVLCSDGISDFATSTQIGRFVNFMRSQAASPEQMADTLTRLTLHVAQTIADQYQIPLNRVSDNITALVVFLYQQKLETSV